MGFLAAAAPIASAVGSLFGGAGKNTSQAVSATGNTPYTAQNLLPAIQEAQSGYGTSQSRIGDVFGAQGALAQQLAAQSQGAGPNIAQLQLEQATNRNIQQGAGQIGSIRGMNPALAARLIAQQTANANQQAAGQSGLMRAEQQLAAQNALANVYGQQGNLAATGGQLANQNLGQNQSALANQNQQIVAANQAAQQTNAQIAQNNANVSGKLIGGLTGGLSSALASPGLADMFKSSSKNLSDSQLSPQALAERQAARGFADGGSVQQPSDNFSKGAKSLADAFKAKGGEISDYRNEGGNVPGEPKYPGDDKRNDVVPAMLSKGEVVLPNSVTKSDDAPDKAKEFMKAILKEKETGPKGFSKILEVKKKMKELHEHMSDMHDMLDEMS